MYFDLKIFHGTSDRPWAKRCSWIFPGCAWSFKSCHGCIEGSMPSMPPVSATNNAPGTCQTCCEVLHGSILTTRSDLSSCFINWEDIFQQSTHLISIEHCRRLVRLGILWTAGSVRWHVESFSTNQWWQNEITLFDARLLFLKAPAHSSQGVEWILFICFMDIFGSVAIVIWNGTTWCSNCPTVQPA